MNKTIIAALLIAAAPWASAEDGISIGLGAGATYGGLGGNVALRSDDDLKFVSIGCLSVARSSSEGTDTVCGPGIGWWKAGLFDAGNRHALGVYWGPVDTKNDPIRLEPDYGVGAGYAYFFRGVGAPGLNIGFMRTFRRTYGELDIGLMAQVGYQF